MPRALAAVVVLVCASACGAAAPAGDEGVTVADGWTVEVVRDDLDGPTQVVVAADGTVLVAQLSGDESAGTGTVVDLGVDATAEEQTVLLDDLEVPTGLAAVGDDLLVQTPTALLRFDGARGGGAPVATVMVDDLPNNGRSQGTLTPLPDGRIAFTATGVGSGPSPAPGSGVLYAVAPDAPAGTAPAVLATGFKNAYAHVPLAAAETVADGVAPLAVTEIGDGSYDGQPPDDELVLVPTTGDAVPVDAGWPVCVGDRVPVVANGGTADECARTRPPLVTFEPRATPTGVADGPGDTVLVALWVEDRVVAVSLFDGTTTDVLRGVPEPQHLVADGDGGWWLTVHGSGELWRLTSEERG